MTAYDPNKAAAYNKLRSQGLTEDQAANQAGISAAESGNYSLGSNGQMGPIVAGTGTVTQAPTAAQQAESARFQAGLQSDANFERVDFAQTSRSEPGQTRPITYTTTSTATVSGGGTTSITAGARIATPASEAAGTAYAAKNAEYNDFIKNNPSDFTRRRQGLPPMTPEEKASYDQKLNTLNTEKQQLKNQQLDAEAGGAPTVTFTPNTTTTQTTTTTSTSVSPGAQNNLNTQTDTAVFNQTESQINSSVPTPSTAQAFPVADPPVITARSTDGPPVIRPSPADQAQLAQIVRPSDFLPVGQDEFNPAKAQTFTGAATGETAEEAEAAARFQINRDATSQFGAGQFVVGSSEVNIRVLGGTGNNITGYRATVTERVSPATTPPAVTPGPGDPGFTAEQPPTPPPTTTPEPVAPTATVIGTDLDNAQEGATAGPPTTAPEPVVPNLFENPPPDGVDTEMVLPPQRQPVPVPTEGDEAIAAADRAQAEQQTAADVIGAVPAPAPVPPAAVATTTAAVANAAPQLNPAVAAAAAGSATAAGTANAQRQSTLQSRKNQPAAADWRVRLQLAAGANYLYADPVAANRGILAPLAATDGVIFPYTPSIDTNYKAKYSSYDLVHSNYRGYFYQSSSVDEISVKGTFTAQDTKEAEYLLAVIHFFRSVTKMFYGQDPQAGTPPPLVFLSGLGQYQFNNHPCLVSNFSYSLPTDVDYIRANGFNQMGLNLENRRTKSSGPAAGGGVPSLGGIALRLLNNALNKGAVKQPPVPGVVTQTVTNQNSVNSTYVPTKMDISITLLPIQTRNQVSQQFSLQGFAQGRLLQGGFW